ncbi:hypothetical protein FRB99_002416 [Tulasnella sp. 403]|nr:hypothetical protein FRB99_002416 [Tulasnella sp. 403]
MKSSEPNQTNGFYEACLVLVRSQGLQAGRIQNALATIWRRALIYDDWERLRVTSGLADSEVAENLRQTVVFDLMQSLTSREDCAELWLPAAEAAVVPPVEEISARFPQYSGAQVNDLRRDYEREQRLLVQHLESSNLEEIYEEIKSLAVAAGAM